MPYLTLNTGMLPHQFSAFGEGLFGGMHSEFERTPKSAAVGAAPAAVAPRRERVRIHWPYVLAELFYVVYQLACATLFVLSGRLVCALGAAYLAACVLGVAWFYGDHIGKVAFVFDRRRPPARRMPS